MIRAAVLGLGAHAVACIVLDAVGAAAVRVATPRLVLVPLGAALGAQLLQRVAGPDARLAASAAVAWLVAGVVHHYLVGIDPLWDDRPVDGLGHVAWDLAFHAPALLLAVAATSPLRSGGGYRAM